MKASKKPNSGRKLHFYLVSLLGIGVVHQDANTGHYGLGPYTLKLGIAGLEQFDIFTASRDRLVGLANDIGHSVFLGVWGNHGPTIVFRADGIHSRSVFELRVGSVTSDPEVCFRTAFPGVSSGGHDIRPG